MQSIPQVQARPKHPAVARHGGFTLIELMIVIAIIAIVAAIAIPSLLQARMSSNEASAVASLRTITSVNMSYRARFAAFADSLATLSSTAALDDVLGSGTKAGYVFTYAGTQHSFQCSADPELPGTSGNRYFYVDSSGVIRFSSTGTAGPSNPPVGD